MKRVYENLTARICALLPASWRWWWKRILWDRAWKSPGYAAPWLGRGVSREIVEAVDEGWFPAGGAALDIGCGQGEVVDWLAGQGFPAVGIDISKEAIARARARYGEVAGRKEFFVSDILAEAPLRRFSILIDRGCLHQIPEVDVPAYAKNAAQACDSGARFLLFVRAFRGGMAVGDSAESDRVRKWVQKALGEYFSIGGMVVTFLDPEEGRNRESALPGLVFRMTRR